MFRVNVTIDRMTRDEIREIQRLIGPISVSKLFRDLVDEKFAQLTSQPNDIKIEELEKQE